MLTDTRIKQNFMSTWVTAIYKICLKMDKGWKRRENRAEKVDVEIRGDKYIKLNMALGMEMKVRL